MQRAEADSWASQRAFRQAARRAHLKYCPRCSAIIEKHRGCNQMKCSCGEIFSWSSAESVATCRQVHFEGRGPCRFWGHTCHGCSRRAKGKLAVVRTAEVVVLTPVAASAVAVCAAGVV